MWFAYIDESKEPGQLCIYSALLIKAEQWTSTYQKVRAFRHELKKEYGIFPSKELHAWKFAAGKGTIADRPLSKVQRADIFRATLQFIVDSGCFTITSSCNRVEQYAFERLVNRIERSAKASNEYVLMFFDQGAEDEITKRIRKMRVHNPIPCSYGEWDANRSLTKNFPLAHCIEDPIFKDSKDSYFIQLADFCAYALLRMECPLPSRTILGYDKMYEMLRPVTDHEHSPKDSRGLGIIR